MLLGLLALATQIPPFEFEYRSGTGLMITAQGVPVVRGSTFQYYEPGWTKGYYSATYNQQQVKKVDANTYEMTFKSGDGRASGRGVFKRQGSKLFADYEFKWTGEKQANVELMAGFIWAPAFQAGSVSTSASFQSKLLPRPYKSRNELDERRLGADAESFTLQSPFAKIQLEGVGKKYTMFDARGYAQDFAEGKELLWYGLNEVQIQPNQSARASFTLELSPTSSQEPAPTEIAAVTRTLKGALAAGGPKPALLPKPSGSTLDFGRTINLSTPSNPDKVVWPIIKDSVSRRFSVAPGPVSKSNWTFAQTPEAIPGSYRIHIQKVGIRVEYADLAGAHHAGYRIAQLAHVSGNQISLPTGRLEDAPATQWRGIHIFIGPTALEFHKRLWTNVLLPMGFNKVVLQCERAEWDCLPNLRGGISMKLADLAKLCDWYRSVGVEPIPLVQSFGHAEWLFGGGANLDLAFNRDVPYAVDPRKPGVKPLFETLWAEVLKITKAKTIHFGLDEVDMRGFPDDPALVTKLWGIQIPMLAEIAKKHKVEFMLWGDKGLAPGEAPDAAHGHDKENAAARRKAIPVGAYITDWHYKADPNPATFMPPLLLWEREGFQPIASSWYRPENIRGFNLAAIAHGFGTLQTTWAGYESNEANMLREAKQFSTMVLAGDYAWSGRQEQLKDLGYDPMKVFQQLMYGRPQSVRGDGGLSLTFNAPVGTQQIGPVKFLMCEPIEFGSSILKAEGLVSQATINVGTLMRELNLALDAEVKCDDGERIATIEVDTNAGKISKAILYGYDLRAKDDPLAIVRGEREKGISVLRMALGQKDVRVKSIRIIRSNGYAGLRVHGITGI